jgi:hypothetical protein
MAEETNGEQGAEPKVDAKAEVKGAITQLEAALDEYMVKKAPFAIPAGIKEFLATNEITNEMAVRMALMGYGIDYIHDQTGVDKRKLRTLVLGE